MKLLYLDNDWEYIWPGTRRNASTGVIEPAAGLTGLAARISATDGGATINAALTQSLVERASLAGEYFAVVDGDALRTHLGNVTYIGRVVWEVFGDGTNVLYSVARTVIEHRRPWWH